MRVLAVPHLEQQLGWLVFLILAIITSVEGYLIFVLISTAVEHLYMCLFATCIPSLMRCLFRLFAHFLLGCLFSYCCKSSLWVLDGYPLSEVAFANIFSQSLSCLLIPFT